MGFLKKLLAQSRRTVRVIVIAVGKRVPALLRWVRATVGAERAREYRSMCAHLPVDPSLVLFESYSGRRYACSPRALYQRLIDPAGTSAAPVRTVWALRKNIAHALLERGYDVRGLDHAYRPKNPFDLESAFGSDALEELRHTVIVPFGSKTYYQMYAKAALWVSNSRLPIHLYTREGQTFVQTWHGTPLKRIGCDMHPDGSANALYETEEMHENYRVEGRRLTYLLSPSRFASEKFTSAFELDAGGRPSPIIEEGYPRNDFLTTYTPADVARVKARLGVPEGKKVVLYAPTWRDNQHSSGVGYTYKAEADFDALRAALGDDYVILFRAHYFISNSFDFSGTGGFVVDVSRVDDINDLYVISDMLVTDYSSVFFDYANLRRPMAFFMYDLDHYESDLRGFYLGLDELPGPVVLTTDALIDAIREATAPDAAEDPRYEGFCARFTYLDDGQASERVIRRLVEAGALPSVTAQSAG